MKYDFNIENPLFFTERIDNTDLSVVYSAALPYGWYETENDSEWKFQYMVEGKIDRQGWKVHISSDMNNSHQVLSIVSKICHDFGVAFKYLTTEKKFVIRNSKNIHRGFGGKFITCYPEESILEKFLNQLEINLKRYDGPYILSDKRWSKAPIFLRYGVFRPCIKEDSLNLKIDELLINGKIVKDLREPKFIVPEGLKTPLFLREWIEESMQQEEEQTEIPFQIENALRFSNSGGIYRGKINDKDVILKEARPFSGIDNIDGIDAVSKLKSEERAMSILKDIDNIPNIYWGGYLWKHYFVAIERINGIPLNRWVTHNYPLYLVKSDDKNYLNRIKNIVDSIVNIIGKAHSNNVYHQDIHLGNIIIDDNDNISIIDWEQSKFSNAEAVKHKVAAPGFRAWGETFPSDIDWYGIKQIAHHLYYPIIIQSDLVYNYVEQTTFMGDNLFKKLNYLDEDIQEYKKLLSYLDNKCPKIDVISENKIIKPLSLEYLTHDKTEKELIIEMMKGISLITKEWNKRRRGRYFPVHFYGININQGIAFSDLGIVWAYDKLLKLSEAKDIYDYDKIKDDILKKTISEFDSSESKVGLFDGIAGSIWMIYELGKKEIAEKLYCDNLSHLIGNSNNNSLYSGLSGILLVGLFFLNKGLKDKETKKMILNNIEILSDQYLSSPEKLFKTGSDNKQSNDPYNNYGGLFYGHAGAGWLFAEAYRMTSNPKFLQCLELSIDMELMGYQKDMLGALQYKQGGRLLPYLSSGSAGLILLLFRNKEFLSDDKLLYMDDLLKAIDSNLCLFPGLFNGFAGLSMVKIMVENVDLKIMLQGLNAYLHTIGDGVVVAGDNGLKVTIDVFSGLGGIAIALSSIINEDFELLPKIDINSTVLL